MYKQLKNLIPNSIQKMLIDFILSKRYKKILDTVKNKGTNPKIYIFGTPEHGNLGDHAIIISQVDFLKKHFPKIEVIEVPFKFIRYYLSEIKELINSKDIVAIMGGGYLGSVWPENEKFVRSIIKNFPDNKVIMFPQTAYYEDTDFGRRFEESSINIYNNHKDLYLIAREKRTFEFFNENYKNANVFLTPDIVLSINKTEDRNRKGVLLCLRNDKEKMHSGIENHTLKFAEKANLEVKSTDTVVNRPVQKKHRDRLFESKLDEFRTADVVVTDRLHGMIFATITSTPCLAFDNSTNKVKGVYEWIRNQGYVTFIEDTEHFEDEFNRLISLDTQRFELDYLKNQFMPIVEAFTDNIADK